MAVLNYTDSVLGVMTNLEETLDTLKDNAPDIMSLVEYIPLLLVIFVIGIYCLCKAFTCMF